ncbi:MAG: (2Fe-2S)-binding protein [Planctomycetes bacterium]|nr:(2Fe-2S)-binding protein [Planctomycetota bacterium]
MPRAFELKINGASRQVETDPRRSLLSVLRDDLDLTGSKYGCGEGECGACTVLLDGRAARSCQVAVEAAAGREITTIEGLAKDSKLHPVQQAFLEAGAMQCGYCTPGMVLAVVALLGQKPKPDEAEVARALQGNLCRCGTYPRILAAVRLAAGIAEERKR